MINIDRLQEKYLKAVSALRVDDSQVKFVGEIKDLLAARTENFHYHVIFDDAQVIGFFNIDIAYPDQYEFAKSSELGLRSFFIDQNQQGKGFGQLAVFALGPYLSQYYSQYSAIVLTVNCKNPAAYQCYKKARFMDTEQLYHGGAAGPQHIMRMEIGA